MNSLSYRALRNSLSLILLAFGFLAPATAQENDCTECLSRKARMCAQECRSVAPEKSLLCQRECKLEYCQSRCEEVSEKVIDTILEPKSCDDCLDRQFVLCASSCTMGTERVLAICKLECAKKNCARWCPSASSLRQAQGESLR